MTRRTLVAAGWGVLAAVALLWPSRVLGVLDGAPLSGRIEALLVGLAAPALWWLYPAALTTTWMRAAIVALLLVKAGASALTPEGLCARFAAPAPIAGVIQTIPIDEPTGVLRSWDVRADWRQPDPMCTAVIDRPYERADAFPAWFLNVLDFVRAGPRDLTLDVTGYARVTSPGVLEWQTGEGMTLEAGTTSGRLEAGDHRLALRARLTGEAWQLVPRWNGEDAWGALTFTQRQPRPFDAVAPVARIAVNALVLVIVLGWIVAACRHYADERALWIWLVASSVAVVVLARDEQLARFAGAALALAALVPLTRRHRNTRGAFLVIGVPWLVFFGARAWPAIGRFTSYSADDWLTYQVAGYRIFMHGYFLEGGTAAFDYQPLYRWMTGALHLVFGDSSVGETFWDAACLLAGALLAFHLVRVRAGFRWGIIAAALTLATFTTGTSWYFLGRGLSEIAAAGWAFLAMFFLLRARLGRRFSSAAAGVCAVLMFYTRLNHLLFAAFVPAMLLRVATPAVWSDVLKAVARVRRAPLAIYAGVFAAGLAAFMLRTWMYTGQVSLFYGTSLRHNDTGLRPWTVLDPEVWRRVGHSLAGLVFMNEPPRPDPRAIVVIAGTLLAVAAMLQIPGARRLPAAVVMAVAGAAIGSLFAHAHHYPGRLSIHLVPLASALAVSSAALMVERAWRPPL